MLSNPPHHSRDIDDNQKQHNGIDFLTVSHVVDVVIPHLVALISFSEFLGRKTETVSKHPSFLIPAANHSQQLLYEDSVQLPFGTTVGSLSLLHTSLPLTARGSLSIAGSCHSIRRKPSFSLRMDPFPVYYLYWKPHSPGCGVTALASQSPPRSSRPCSFFMNFGSIPVAKPFELEMLCPSSLFGSRGLDTTRFDLSYPFGECACRFVGLEMQRWGV